MAGPSPQSLRDADDAPPADFELIYREEWPRLMRYLLINGADRNDAEDVAQYAFEQLFYKRETIRDPAAWLRTVAYRRMLQMQARSQRFLEPGHYERYSPPASERIERHEEAAAVLVALSRLPAMQRKVAALYYDEFKINEIGEILEMTNAAVRQNLSRARQRLKDQLESSDPGLRCREAA
jgi:RNA polymerase sigma factor (sigma-70 family)